MIGPGCILAVLLRLRRPLRLRLLLLLRLLGLLRLLLLWLLLGLLLLLRRRSLLRVRRLLRLRLLLRRLVRVPLLGGRGLLVVDEVAHRGGGATGDEDLRDGEVYRLEQLASDVCECRQLSDAQGHAGVTVL